MKHKLIYVLLWVISSSGIYAQKATVTFTTEKDCEVMIYEPLDGGYNRDAPKIRLIVTTTKPVVYKTSVSPYMFMYCRFPQCEKTCNLLLFPNDNIRVHINNKRVRFQGSNQAGLQYFYDNFTSVPFGNMYTKMENIFKEYVALERDIHSIVPTINKAFVFPYIDDIEKLPLTSNTTVAFTNVLKTNTLMLFNSSIVNLFTHLLLFKENRVVAIKDSAEIGYKIDSIFNKIPITRQLYGYTSQTYTLGYLSYYYGKKECPAGYDKKTFGPYKTYLYAPEDMQPALLGGACMVQLKYNPGEMDMGKMRKFFNEKFPQSEYTAIINERVKEEANAIDTPLAEQLFIKDKIDSLAQFKDIQKLKGNYLFIDLWASWCMPCRGEFSHKEQLENLLSTYNNVAAIYISIDNEKQEKAWLSCIKQYKLGGFHLRASTELQKNILKQIYGKDEYNIPRYILIDPNGEIVHKDLPRPSNVSKLKETLDSIIK